LLFAASLRHHSPGFQGKLLIAEPQPGPKWPNDPRLKPDNLMEVPFDFDRPSASLRREGTWPKPPLYGPDYRGIWKSLYVKFAWISTAV
jgi:hypothetical protein